LLTGFCLSVILFCPRKPGPSALGLTIVLTVLLGRRPRVSSRLVIIASYGLRFISLVSLRFIFDLRTTDPIWRILPLIWSSNSVWESRMLSKSSKLEKKALDYIICFWSSLEKSVGWTSDWRISAAVSLCIIAYSVICNFLFLASCSRLFKAASLASSYFSFYLSLSYFSCTAVSLIFSAA
jgi:hypothetical protein